MYRSSEQNMRTLSRRNSELLEFAKTLEDRVTQLNQQPNNETELCNLRAIIRHLSMERLCLDKTIAENHLQTRSQLDELRQANSLLEGQNRDLQRRVSELEKLVENNSSEQRNFLTKLDNFQSLKTQLARLENRIQNMQSDLEYVKLRTNVEGRLNDNNSEDDPDRKGTELRLSQLEAECSRLATSNSELHRDLYELCALVLDITAKLNVAGRRPHGGPPDDVVTAGARASSPRLAARTFVVRYSYNPFKSSPNTDPESELSLAAGERVTVFGSVDSDGFYDGQTADGRRGLIPSNYVERLQEELLPVRSVARRPSRSPVLSRRPVLGVSTRPRLGPVTATAAGPHTSQSALSPALFTRRRSAQRARWRGTGLVAARARKSVAASPRTTGKKMMRGQGEADWLHPMVVRGSSPQPSPRRREAAASSSGAVSYNTGRRRDDRRANAERLRDHWSQSSYSPEEEGALVTGEDAGVQRPVYRRQDAARSTSSSMAAVAAATARSAPAAAAAASHRQQAAAGPPSESGRYIEAAEEIRPRVDDQVRTVPTAQSTSPDARDRLLSMQTNRARNGSKALVTNHDHTHGRQAGIDYVTSAAALADRMRRDDGSMTSSTGPTTGPTSMTRITLTPPSRNSSYEALDGDARSPSEPTNGDEPPPPDSKSQDDKAVGGILARGQKLFKQLVHLND